MWKNKWRPLPPSLPYQMVHIPLSQKKTEFLRAQQLKFKGLSSNRFIWLCSKLVSLWRYSVIRRECCGLCTFAHIFRWPCFKDEHSQLQLNLIARLFCILLSSLWDDLPGTRLPFPRSHNSEMFLGGAKVCAKPLCLKSFSETHMRFQDLTHLTYIGTFTGADLLLPVVHFIIHSRRFFPLFLPPSLLWLWKAAKKALQMWFPSQVFEFFYISGSKRWGMILQVWSWSRESPSGRSHKKAAGASCTSLMWAAFASNTYYPCLLRH